MLEPDADLRDRLVRVETKLDIVIGNHNERLIKLEKEVAALNALRWVAVGMTLVAAGTGGLSLFSLLGGP